MPTVPRRADRDIVSAPIPGVRLNPNAPAGAFKSVEPIDITPVAKNLIAVIQREEEKADTIRAIEADAQAADAQRQFLYDQQAGALNLRGSNVLEGGRTARENFTKRMDEIENGLGNDRQKLQFQRVRANRDEQFNDLLARHTASEMAEFGKAATAASVDKEFALATYSYDKPEIVEASVQHQRAVLWAAAEVSGEPQDVTALRVKAETSRIRSAVLSMYSAKGQDLAGKEYLEKYRADLLPKDLLEAEKEVETASTLGESQRQSDSIIARAGITEKEAFDLARTIADPNVRQLTERNLDTEFRRRESAERGQGNRLFTQASQFAERGRRPPATIWANLSLQDRNSIDARIKQLASGTKPTTNWDTYYALKRAAADPATRKDFATENLLRYRSQLDEPEFKELVNAQAAMLKGGDDSLVTGYRSTAATVGKAIKKLRLNATQADNLDRAVDRAVIEWKRANDSKEIPSEEVDKIIDRTVVQHVYIDRPKGRDGKYAVGLVAEDQRGRAYVPVAKIPEAQRNRLSNLFRRSGTPVTESKLSRAYAAALLGDDARLQAIIGEK